VRRPVDVLVGPGFGLELLHGFSTQAGFSIPDPATTKESPEEVPMATATEQIRTEEPVKNTFHNLVQTLNVKLDSAARYRLYQEDARKDGFDDCAKLFGELQQSEQKEIQGLVRCLRQHIDESGAGE
jgi:hypothetical protein